MSGLHENIFKNFSDNWLKNKFSDELFKKFFNLNHVLLSISTFNDGIFIAINDYFLSCLEYSRDEVIGKSATGLGIYRNTEERRELMKKVENAGKITGFELVVRSKSGNFLTGLFSMEKISIEGMDYLFTSAINITRLNAVERKMKHYLNQQVLLANISQKLNMAQNGDENVRESLKLLGKHTNVSRISIFEDIEGGKAFRDTFEWCNKGIKPKTNQMRCVYYDSIPSWKKIFNTGNGIFMRNIDDLPPDVAELLKRHDTVSVLILPLYPAGDFSGFISLNECYKERIWSEDEIELLKTVANIISNFFERRLMNERLKESEMRLKLALESSQEGLWDWNISTGSVFFNERCCKMIGYEQYEIEPNVKSWERLVHPEDMPEVMKTLEKHLNGKTDFYETTHRVKTKDGGWKWILDHGKVVERDSSGKPARAIGTHIDINQQKEMEIKLQESITTRDKLFSIIAHDLRNPIASFINVLEFVTDERKKDEKAKNFLLDELKKTSRRAGQLLENLLNWAQFQQNQIEFRPSAFSMTGAINENIQLLKTIAEGKKIKISFTPEKEFLVFADRDMINLIIRNLITNAIKFTRENGAINISARSDDNMTEVAIADNGVGIKKEIFEKLFNPNVFKTTAGTNDEKGSGLGLILCRDFIEKNGGSIRAETTAGAGSVFYFTVPCHNN